MTQLLKKGFHVTLGATASLIEALQHSDKREENLAQLKLNFSELTEIWAQKGEVTELEARNIVDSVLAQSGHQSSSSSASGVSNYPAAPSTQASVQLELQELTAQLAAIRAELEQLRNEPGI